jgi:hypothetical protein
LRWANKAGDLPSYPIVTYERRPGYWRAAITPYRQSGNFILVVTPDDFASEHDAKAAAEKMIRTL